MDYASGPKYPEVCQEAVKKDLIINTVQCGSIAATTPFWKEIAKLSEGSYAAIAQSGNMVVIATPMDGELAELNRKLGTTLVAYGGERARRAVASKQLAAEAAPASVAADRLAFNARSGVAVQGEGELLDGLSSGKVKLESLKKDQLPPSCRNWTSEELKAEIGKKQTGARGAAGADSEAEQGAGRIPRRRAQAPGRAGQGRFVRRESRRQHPGPGRPEGHRVREVAAATPDRQTPPVSSRSGCRLCLTGQALAAASNLARSAADNALPLGKTSRVFSEPMRRTGSAVISLITWIWRPSMLRLFRCATSPMTVAMQVPSAVATRSVGEKAAPLPPLSTGASVVRVCRDGPWVAAQ